jgi:hypothetical protein
VPLFAGLLLGLEDCAVPDDPSSRIIDTRLPPPDDWRCARRARRARVAVLWCRDRRYRFDNHCADRIRVGIPSVPRLWQRRYRPLHFGKKSLDDLLRVRIFAILPVLWPRERADGPLNLSGYQRSHKLRIGVLAVPGDRNGRYDALDLWDKPLGNLCWIGITAVLAVLPITNRRQPCSNLVPQRRFSVQQCQLEAATIVSRDCASISSRSRRHSRRWSEITCPSASRSASGSTAVVIICGGKEASDDRASLIR